MLVTCVKEYVRYRTVGTRALQRSDESAAKPSSPASNLAPDPAQHQRVYEFLSFAGNLLTDLHVYNPPAGAWIDLSSGLKGSPPSPRSGLSSTSAGGKLYIFGGKDSKGDPRRLQPTSS
jgi:hypothetical protein